MAITRQMTSSAHRDGSLVSKSPIRILAQWKTSGHFNDNAQIPVNLSLSLFTYIYWIDQTMQSMLNLFEQKIHNLRLATKRRICALAQNYASTIILPIHRYLTDFQYPSSDEWCYTDVLCTVEKETEESMWSILTLLFVSRMTGICDLSFYDMQAEKSIERANS